MIVFTIESVYGQPWSADLKLIRIQKTYKYS